MRRSGAGDQDGRRQGVGVGWGRPSISPRPAIASEISGGGRSPLKLTVGWHGKRWALEATHLAARRGCDLDGATALPPFDRGHARQTAVTLERLPKSTRLRAQLTPRHFLDASADNAARELSSRCQTAVLARERAFAL